MYRTLGATTVAFNKDLVFSALARDDKASVVAEAGKLSESERAAMFKRAIEALPACYGEHMSRCAWGDMSGASWPWSQSRCEDIALGYLADWSGMSKAVEAMSYCDENAKWFYGVAGFFGGIAAATVVLAALK